MFVFMFFFFKQKTAYEMRISDWSSDVCSSDLFRLLRQFPDLDPAAAVFEPVRLTVARAAQLIKVNKEVNTALRYRDDAAEDRWEIGWREGDCEDFAIRKQIGRASCRERVCQYV